jgi:hypothetical protein
MGFFERFRQRHVPERELEPEPSRDYDHEQNLEPEPVPDPDSITVSRTLVKSEPELAELVSSDPRLSGEGLDVNLAEKGFGTRVEISAPAGGELGLQELEALLDDLAQPQKRPFSTG